MKKPRQRRRPSATPLALQRALYRHYGPLGWWPGETPFEVMAGAILTQNTAWTNVEKAIANLKAAGKLSPQALHALRADDLARLIRPSGYFRVKARRLKNLTGALTRDFGGDLDALFALPTEKLRAWLLQINGVGKETADSILCYAAGHPVFVVDAYTRRVFHRHGLTPEDAGYDELQAYALSRLPRDIGLYNEFHAGIVHVGKDFCRPTPRCAGCPLEKHL